MIKRGWEVKKKERKETKENERKKKGTKLLKDIGKEKSNAELEFQYEKQVAMSTHI